MASARWLDKLHAAPGCNLWTSRNSLPRSRAAVGQSRSCPLRIASASAFHSSSVRASSATSPSPSGPPSAPLEDLLNPPADTRPPPFTPHVRSASDTTFSYYYAVGKTFGRFYWAAMGQLWRTHKLGRSIKLQNRSQSSEQLSAADFARLRALPPSPSSDSSSSSPPSLAVPTITRAQYQTLIRSRENLKCLPPFLLLFAVCGEWTPLVAPFCLRIIPYAAKTPAMADKERRDLETRRRESLRSGVGGRVLQNAAKATRSDRGGAWPGDVGQLVDTLTLNRLTSDELYALSVTLDISTRPWSYWERLPFLSILRWRVKRALDRLAIDDAMLLHHVGSDTLVSSAPRPEVVPLLIGRHLGSEELRIAAIARGIDVVGRPNEALARDIGRWLANRSKGSSMEELLFSRPKDIGEGSTVS